MRDFKFIDKIGIELEGGWIDPDFLIGHDGSVNVRANVVGELASPILSPGEVEEWMLKHYPDAINDTCGLHVHISLKHIIQYANLMENAFFKFFIEQLALWGKEKKIIKNHPFWNRINGNNRYCKPEFIPEKQVHQKSRHDDRYTMLNYTWAKFKTIECRVLPGFKMPKLGVAAVLKTMDLFEDYLSALKTPRERALVKEIVFEEDDVETISLEGIIPLELNLDDISLELNAQDDNLIFNREVF